MSNTITRAEVIYIDLYLRMSKGDDGTIYKIDDQEHRGNSDVAQWARSQGLTFGPEGQVRIGKVFYDHGKSAWNTKVERPNFRLLVKRLETGEAQGVWVRDLDRYARKVLEGERLIQMAEKGLHVLAGHSSYDLTRWRDRQRFRDVMVDAEAESDRISERTCNGKADKARRGKSNATWRGFGRPGYLPNPEGWEHGDPRKLCPEERVNRERDAIRDAAAGILRGETLSSVCRSWNEAGLLTVTGKLWDGAALKAMLIAPSLAGLIEYKGKIVGQLDGEPVLDRDTWDRLQSHFAARKPGRPATTYLLSGFARCGLCGQVLKGRPLTKRTYEDGSVRREYYCQPRPNTAHCGRIGIDQRLTDKVIERATITRLGDPRHADRLARRASKVEEARLALITEKARQEDDAMSLASKVAEWGFARVDAAMQPINARLADLQQKLDALETPDTTSSRDAAAEWKAAGIQQRRAMVQRAFPEGITILPTTTAGGKTFDDGRIHYGPPPGKDGAAA